jgi:hypothetical protein
MIPYKIFNAPVDPKWPDYGCNIYKDEVFVEGRIYSNYSGNAMMDEMKDLKRYEFKPEDGYKIEW